MLPEDKVDPASSTDMRERIFAAVLALAGKTGLRKLAMDEVARRARVSRASLYNHFSGRDALIAETVTRELDLFFANVGVVVEQYRDPDERLIAGFAVAYRQLSTHPAIRPILDMNPELLVPYVITQDSYALNLGARFVESFTAGDDLDDVLRGQFAEHVARAFHTLILIPSTRLGLDDPDGPERYARDFLLPVLDHLRASGRSD